MRPHAAAHHINNQPVPLPLLSLLQMRQQPISTASGSGICCLLGPAACIRCTLLAAAIATRLLLLLALRRRGAAGAGLRGGPGGIVSAGQQLQALLLVLPPQVQPLLLQPGPAAWSGIEQAQHPV
jgi:hypothetical protein